MASVDTLNVMPAIALPAQYGGPGVTLAPGQVLRAVVLALLDDNVARLQLPQAVIDIRANIPLVQGAHLTLAVQGSGAHAKLVILSSDLGAPGQAAGHPIGEATVLGRVPPTRAAPAPVVDAPSISPARPDPVPQALAEAVRAAATRQGGLAPLFANLEQVMRGEAKLPDAVKAAAAQVLAARLSLDGSLTATDLKQAVARSGVFLEARLGMQNRPASGPAPGPATTAAPAPQGDLKAALLVLRQVLQTWSQEARPPQPDAPAAGVTAPAPALAAQGAMQNARTIGLALAGLTDGGAGESAAKAAPATLPAAPLPAPAAGSAAPLAPPYRGAPTAAQPPVPPTISDDTPPHESAERLIRQTDAALARQTLLQAASLPERVDDTRSDPAAQRLSFEIPFASPQGTAVAQFEISRDGHRGAAEGHGPVWRARFSLDVEPMGPVHALVTIVGARASVTLWAEREASAACLAEGSAELAQSLRQAELEPGEIQFRIGAPQRPRPAAGQFLDRAS